MASPNEYHNILHTQIVEYKLVYIHTVNLIAQYVEKMDTIFASVFVD